MLTGEAKSRRRSSGSDSSTGAVAQARRRMPETTTTSLAHAGAVAKPHRASSSLISSSPHTARCSAAMNGQVHEGEMIRHLREIGDFVRYIRIHSRFGDLSRARLKLLRFEVHGNEAECNFLARRADVWDADVPTRVSERNVSTQALRDAISVRSLLFRLLPDVSKAVLRVYRMSGESIELVITGVVRREEQAPATVRSLTMRAKLCGLQFWLDDGILEPLHFEECLVGV